MHSLLTFHAAADKRGDGLLPELVALLQSQVAAKNNQADANRPTTTPRRAISTRDGAGTVRAARR